MDLWIRSQDREMLCKVECVELMHDDPEYAKIFLNGQFPDLIAGAYEKERAIEVLDEIQNLLYNKEIKIESLQVQQEKEYERIKELIKNGRFYALPESSVEYVEPSCIVYEMPKE